MCIEVIYRYTTKSRECPSYEDCKGNVVLRKPLSLTRKGAYCQWFYLNIALKFQIYIEIEYLGVNNFATMKEEGNSMAPIWDKTRPNIFVEMALLMDIYIRRCGGETKSINLHSLVGLLCSAANLVFELVLSTWYLG